MQNLFSKPNYFLIRWVENLLVITLFAVLLQDIDCYILDEPFNGIDFQSSMILFDLIELLKGKHKTVLISSHIFSTLKQGCDEIVLLEDKHFKCHVSKEQFDWLEDKIHAESMDVNLNIWE